MGDVGRPVEATVGLVDAVNTPLPEDLTEPLETREDGEELTDSEELTDGLLGGKIWPPVTVT